MNTTRKREPQSIREELVRALQKLKYKKSFIEAAVPSWWTAEVERDPGTVELLKMLLAGRLGLDLDALVERDEVIPFAPEGLRFRRSSALQNDEPPTPNLAYYLAVVQVLVAAMPESELALPPPQEIRDQILRTDRFVSLESLVRYCWSKGVAVVQMRESAAEKKGAQALVFPFDARRVIILTEKINDAQQSKAAFFIAHELGHIALGHVDADVVLLDEEVGAKTRSFRSDIETSADTFASTLLSGDTYDESWVDRGLKAERFAQRARAFGEQRRIDPVHVLLRYGKENPKFFPQAVAAVNSLRDPAAPLESRLINDIAERQLDFTIVGSEAQQIIRHALA